MKKQLLTIALCMASLLGYAQTNPNASFGATVYAQQSMTDNESPSYMVNWAILSNGATIDNSQADIASHVTTLNIDASAISGTISSISVYALDKNAIAGPLYFNGSDVSTPAGGSPNIYASNGQSDVVMVNGSSNTCTAYLLPIALNKGVKVTVKTSDGKFYSQDFTDAISAGAIKSLTITNTTANNLWMATIPGSTYFSFVSTPGAHNAATSSVTGVTSSYAKCQSENIADLLANGVRGFDLRPNYNNSSNITKDNLYLCHGSYNTNVKYVDAMQTLVNFVKNNPSEAISVVMVKEAGSGSSDRSNDMWSVINACHSEHTAYMKLLDHSYYTLDDFRGKICYINRTGTDCTNTTHITNWPDNENITNYSAAIGGTCFANIQDKYNTNGTDKQNEVKSMLQISSNNTEKKNFHYNFLSSAYQILGNTPSGYASSTNPEISTYLNGNNISGPAGYVYADFIGSSSNGGAALLTAIINQNYRYVYKGRSISDKPSDDNWDFAQGSDVNWTKAGNWSDAYGTTNGEVHVTENYAGYWSQEQTDYSLFRNVSLPAGIYKLTAYAFYRDGVIGSAKLVAKNGTKMCGCINIKPMDEISSSDAGSGGTVDLRKAANSFTGDNYLNTVYFVLPEPAEVTVGFEGKHTGMKQWFVAGPVTLEKIDRFEDGTDVTSLIANPTIYSESQSSCPSGWTCYARTAGNGNYTTSTGDTQIENWHGTPSNARFDYYQTLNLPAGKYTLNAELLYRNGQGDEVGIYAYDVVTRARVTASPTIVDASLHPVTLEFTTTGGEVNIGIINLKTMTGDWFAADNFTLIYNGMEVITRSTKTGKYGTICAPFVANVDGAKVYSASLNAAKTAVELTEVTSMVAGVPYIYQATADAQTFSYKEGSVVLNPVANDILTGVFKPTAVPVGAYVMQTKGDVQKFYVVADGKQPTLSEYKAYLTVPTAGVKAFNIGVSEETAIKAIDALVNGDAKIYDLNGRELKSLQKGVNIVNGVKVMVK